MLSLLAIIEDGFFLQSGSSRWSYGIHQRGKRISLYPNLFPEGPKILFSVKISRFWTGWAAVRRGFFQERMQENERAMILSADPTGNGHTFSVTQAWPLVQSSLALATL